MIVYGDAEFETALSRLLGGIEGRLRATDLHSVDDLRSLLVQAGQMEQALADQPERRDTAALAERFTDAVASAFVQGLPLAEVGNAFAQLRSAVAKQEFPLRVKIPEGFEFYNLFPEQYRATAQRWANEYAKCDVLVVGIRSIGTSLSAIVRATLIERGFFARRITVRPEGHPFAREVELPVNLAAAAAIVVDEGPGLSGSSMACVAEELIARGVREEAISLFPGSACDPGPQASEAVRRRWARTKRYFTPLEKISWHGNSLREELMDRTTEVLGSHAVAIDEPGADWPVTVSIFERAKFQVATHSGAALLWKFTGFHSLGSTPIVRQLEARARLGWTPTPLATHLGFTATRWIDGEHLTSSDTTPAVLDEIARYIADTVGEPLSGAEAQAATQRLRHMMGQNSLELGLSNREFDHALIADVAALPAYGDGRMMPHGWIWTGEDRLLKMDAHDHSCDHTIVGRQPFLWDVAGTIVEWELGPDQTENFLNALQRLNLRVRRDALDSYVRAYAIFRAGLMAFAAASANAEEAERSRAATECYRARANFSLPTYRELAGM